MQLTYMLPYPHMKGTKMFKMEHFTTVQHWQHHRECHCWYISTTCSIHHCSSRETDQKYCQHSAGGE